MTTALPEELDLHRAAEIRNEDDERVFGCWKTLRRDIERDLLPAVFKQGKYVVRREDLEALPAKKAAAKRGEPDLFETTRRQIASALNATPPLPPDKRAELAGMLAPAGGGQHG
ncbi:hypothetical protein [Nesterenkonia sp. Act20]|uniref:hypothetical protein n=1 Tax=Nesterenkonia sp. Act20 TaxID=1483432 RepID=UPI001C45160C|nr:hypothetical protein [Nesterenkonia sp. Act20]